MDTSEIIRSSIKNVFANKLRTMLTMFGIIIGISSVIAINAIGNGSIASIEEELSSMGPNLITLRLRNSNPKNLVSNDSLKMSDYEYLKENLEGYSEISPYYSSSAREDT